MRYATRKTTGARRAAIRGHDLSDDPEDTAAVEFLRLWLGLARLRQASRSMPQARLRRARAPKLGAEF